MDRKKLILVVDDEEDIRDILVETLEGLGFDHMTACDGSEAIGLIDQYPNLIDAIICDLKMPKVSGDQVIIHVHRHHPIIPIIILTGFAQLDMALDHMRLGAFDYMTKPFRVQELLFLLNRALEFRALQEIRDSSGTQFDPLVVKTFIQVFDRFLKNLQGSENIAI